MSKKEYTLAHIFDPSLSKVLLIHKNRPEWQAGKMNGIGGKLEVGETTFEGISREVWEETGLRIPITKWQHVIDLEAKDWVVHIFTTTYKDLSKAISKTDEEVEVCNVSSLPSSIVPNLAWEIPICKDALSTQEKRVKFAKVIMTQV